MTYLSVLTESIGIFLKTNETFKDFYYDIRLQQQYLEANHGINVFQLKYSFDSSQYKSDIVVLYEYYEKTSDVFGNIQYPAYIIERSMKFYTWLLTKHTKTFHSAIDNKDYIIQNIQSVEDLTFSVDDKNNLIASFILQVTLRDYLRKELDDLYK